MSQKNILGSISSIVLLLTLSGSVTENKIESPNLVASSAIFHEVALSKTLSPGKDTEEKLAIANNHLGFKLFNHIFNPAHNQNIFISPTSIAIALAMTYNGASGKTEQIMASALALPEISRKDLNLNYQKLQQSLQKVDPQVQLSIANSFWAKQGIPFKHKFLKNNRAYYSASITNLNFTNPRAKSIINGWVKEATQGKIERIIDDIKAEDILFLINAIYFKGNWTYQFDKNLTTSESFHVSANFSKPHPMMSQTGEYRYYENEQFQAISLPYGQNRLSMYIFLPHQNSNLANLVRDLTPQKWQNWLTQFRLTSGSIKIPRFHLESEVELKQALTALGMGEVFAADRADFSGMTSHSVSLDRIKHKTLIEVNEKGTEVAAATSIGISATSLNSAKPFAMIVNRPFFCAIADNQTGRILFMGSIFNPS